MLRFTCLFAALAVVLGCPSVSPRFNETIAHAIHSLTVEDLRMFHPRATDENTIPTVNHNLQASNKVLDFAPSDAVGRDFHTYTMNTIDHILSNVGKHNDGLGKHWSPVERIAHVFHMRDLWAKIHTKYVEVLNNPPSEATCSCLMNTTENGIYKAVAWVADHYESGTPITLLNRPIPKLEDASSWTVWKDRLLHYYTQEALLDGATFMYCATKHF
eukprot:NODE_6788_length_817_cov_185.047550_g6552_i0.p1 GENE.NODE_6788_length_817_cov_185.047550_g6552_i0~~NODE_6788_length_817_cov_185.047550_g6552_i0.p1  ORF type:complete len:232 (-),score=76.83 NODE_6788_length_817_cov_185.047550_g6552_i0:120-767(-)